MQCRVQVKGGPSSSLALPPGIGEAAAVHLARRGFRALATSRSLSRLDPLMETADSEACPLTPYQLDPNDSDSVNDTVARMGEEHGTIFGLVNNAGYGLRGCMEDLTIQELQDQFETNLFGALRMSQAVLPGMRNAGAGRIVDVGSVLGQLVAPDMGAYSASKHALKAMNAAMRMETARFGVKVVLVEPGLFRSNFSGNQVTAARSLDPDSPYRAYARVPQKNPRTQIRWGGDPFKVARVIHKAITSRWPAPRYAVGPDARLGALAARFVPDRLVEFFTVKAVAP